MWSRHRFHGYKEKEQVGVENPLNVSSKLLSEILQSCVPRDRALSVNHHVDTVSSVSWKNPHPVPILGEATMVRGGRHKENNPG